LSPADRTIHAISFDLDDTLWPVEPVIAQAEQAVHDWLAEQAPALTAQFDVDGLRELRLAMAREHPEQAHDLSLMRRLSLERACRLSGVDTALAEPAFQVFFAARNRVRWYDDAKSIIPFLAARFELLALTNGNADPVLTGLAPLFRFRISAMDAGAAKPDPRMFQLASRRLGLAPAEILHVGDDPERDGAAALAAGYQAVLLHRGSQPYAGKLPVPCIRSLHELPALLGLEAAPPLAGEKQP